MLEEPNIIDMILDEQGQAVLVVVDAAITEDKVQRRKLLDAKLQNYAKALAGGNLKDLPDPQQAKIRIVCADPPEAVYGGLNSLSIASSNGQAYTIPVTFQHLPSQYG